KGSGRGQHGPAPLHGCPAAAPHYARASIPLNGQEVVEVAQITQHEAAELWELCRDHVVGASSIRFMAQGVRDPQLRSMLERHAGEYERAGHRIQQFLHEHGTGGYGGGPGAYGECGSPGFGQAGTHGPWSTQSPTHGAWPAPNAGYTSGSSPFDLMAAATCLDMCKS